uniref:Uncharacterized protein MANES_09G089000 n=1 Tax=Rhizophora mucronata TaxID=61149 RepID=A0A2P2JJJ7_RHIMU
MSNLELLLVKEDKEEVDFNLLERANAEFQAESHVNDSQDRDSCQHGQEERSKEEKDDEKEEERKTCTDSFAESKKSPSLGELNPTGDDDYDGGDGFRTPTSLEHKIPAIKECPPAPRKAKPLPSLKRKASPPNACISLLLDLSQEVKSPSQRPARSDLHEKTKKARTPDDDQPIN